MHVWGATPTPHIFWHSAFQTPPYWVSKNTNAGIFGAEVCAHGAPRQLPTLFGILHFKHTHTGYPKTLLLTYVVQKYARLGRHAKTQREVAGVKPKPPG